MFVKRISAVFYVAFIITGIYAMVTTFFVATGWIKDYHPPLLVQLSVFSAFGLLSIATFPFSRGTSATKRR